LYEESLPRRAATAVRCGSAAACFERTSPPSGVAVLAWSRLLKAAWPVLNRFAGDCDGVRGSQRLIDGSRAQRHLRTGSWEITEETPYGVISKRAAAGADHRHDSRSDGNAPKRGARPLHQYRTEGSTDDGSPPSDAIIPAASIAQEDLGGCTGYSMSGVLRTRRTSPPRRSGILAFIMPHAG